MKIAVLFPGQGSQYIGMGQEFIKEDPESGAVLAEAEKICDLPIGKLCSDGPMELLTQATVLQPAITITNIICWHKLQKAIADKWPISCLAGHSLGEYSALYAAGVISLEDTIRLVGKRGALMEREGNNNPGGMRAVIGLSIEDIEEIIENYDGGGIVTVANHNTPEQIVISGSKLGLDGLSRLVEAKGAKVIPLNVSVANHSPLVEQAIPDFSRFMDNISFDVPSIPVYCNVSGKIENESQEIKGLMARQIAAKVRWCEIIMNMHATGIDTFIEVGPKTVLKGMIKKILPKGANFTAMQIDTPETLGNCIKTLDSMPA